MDYVQIFFIPINNLLDYRWLIKDTDNFLVKCRIEVEKNEQVVQKFLKRIEETKRLNEFFFSKDILKFTCF